MYDYYLEMFTHFFIGSKYVENKNLKEYNKLEYLHVYKEEASWN